MEKSSRVLILFYRLLQREHIRKANFAMKRQAAEQELVQIEEKLKQTLMQNSQAR